ncbi:MAG: macro domain-containing protein, partial [Candidatus Dadabacteria bacterium]
PEIIILRGVITGVVADAIVNAANSVLVLGSGVAGAIRRKGGPSIQAECEGKSPVPLGEAAITGGGDLKARHVIHAAAMHLGGSVSAESLRNAALNSLKRASEAGIKTIAFPAIGTGVGGFPLGECAEIMLDVVIDRAAEFAPGLESVYFVLFDEEGERVFRAALEERLGNK